MTEIVIIIILLLLFVFIFYKNSNIISNNNTNNKNDTVNKDNNVKEKEQSEIDEIYVDRPMEFNPYIYDRMYNPYYFLGSPYTYPYVSYAYDPRPVPHYRSRPVFYTEHRPNYNYTKKIHRKNHRK